MNFSSEQKRKIMREILISLACLVLGFCLGLIVVPMLLPLFLAA